MTTKKEFISMIKRAGNDMPIDLAILPIMPVANVWRGAELYGMCQYANFDIRKTGQDGIVIDIYGLEIRNPPSLIEKLTFTKYSRGVHSPTNKIGDELAEEAISKLVFRKVAGMLVKMPKSGTKALYGMADEPTDYEWGGGIDFEIIKGKPQVERILSYFGDKGQVPWDRIMKKYGKDIEVRFHTHPRSKYAVPSKSDIASFIQCGHQVDLIVAQDQILIMEKTKLTPEYIPLESVESRTPDIGYTVRSEREQRRDLKKIEKEYHIKMKVVRYPRDIVFDLNVIRNISK